MEMEGQKDMIIAQKEAEIQEMKAKMDEMAGEFGDMLKVRVMMGVGEGLEGRRTGRRRTDCRGGIAMIRQGCRDAIYCYCRNHVAV